MAIQIAPSILAADFLYIGEALKDLEEAGADALHCDVMDGCFVPNISFGPDVLSAIRRGTDMMLDVHLMLEHPDRYAEVFMKAGADALTFHVESRADPASLIEEIHRLGMKAGLALSPATPVETILPYLGELDNILVMSVVPGFCAQSFHPEVLEKVERIKGEVKTKGFSCTVQIDGGIQEVTAPLAIEAGADYLVSGSYLFKGGSSDISRRIKVLRGE